MAGVSSCETKEPWKLWQESDFCFPIQPRKKSVNFVPAAQRVEISNFMGLVFLKGKLVRPKTVAGVSFYDTEGLWKVLGKSDYWFQIEPKKKKSVNFVTGSQTAKISTLMGFFFVKGILADPKTVARVPSCDTERPYKVWRKSDYCFPNPPRKKSVNFTAASQRVQISNLMGLVFRKGTLVEPKTVAGVLSDNTEMSWLVWVKTDPCFPIQPKKKSVNFTPASQRVQISNLMGLVFRKGALVEPKTVAGV